VILYVSDVKAEKQLKNRFCLCFFLDQGFPNWDTFTSR